MSTGINDPTADTANVVEMGTPMQVGESGATADTVLLAVNNQTRLIEECMKRLENNETRITTVEAKAEENSTGVAKVTAENTILREQMHQLRISFEVMKQNQLKNYIDILGVPEVEGEDLKVVIANIAKVSDVQLENNNIVKCYRQVTTASRASAESVYHPTIVVELCSEQIKSAIRKGLKDRNAPLLVSDINIGLNDSTIVYVNERLTPHMKKVFLMAKKAQKDNLIKYVWSNNGKIFGRLTDEAPTLTFLDVRDVQLVIGEAEIEGAPEQRPVINRRKTLAKTKQVKRKNDGENGIPEPKRVLRGAAKKQDEK